MGAQTCREFIMNLCSENGLM